MKHSTRLLAFLSLFSLSHAEEGYTDLFDGETLAGWTHSSGKAIEEGKWIAENGVLHRAGRGGSLFSVKEYGDFDFKWEWKISKRVNSGVKYRLTKYGRKGLGLEFQILDNNHPNGQKNPKHRTAALYDLFQISDEESPKPIGEWNTSRIVAVGGHFQHYLNGKLVIDITVGSDEWKAAHAASKFADIPDFATKPSGRLQLQDHGGEVWFRNLKIKELDSDWTNLFNGKDLSGWTVMSGKAKYTIEGDTIVGTTEEGSPNTFLSTDKLYDNFELEFDVKVHNSLNSGVMIRSSRKNQGKDKYGGRIFGPQVEIEASGEKGAEAGYIFGEATGRSWITPKDLLIPHKLMKDGEWNHFRVIANGANIKTWINGEAVSDLSDEEIFKSHPKGRIGLQVHSIGKNTGPFTVAWKNIRIKELK